MVGKSYREVIRQEPRVPAARQDIDCQELSGMKRDANLAERLSI